MIITPRRRQYTRSNVTSTEEPYFLRFQKEKLMSTRIRGYWLLQSLGPNTVRDKTNRDRDCGYDPNERSFRKNEINRCRNDQTSDTRVLVRNGNETRHSILLTDVVRCKGPKVGSTKTDLNRLPCVSVV